MRKLLSVISSISIVSIALTTYSQAEVPTAATKAPSKNVETTPVKPLDPSTVAAVINGKAIKISDIDHELSRPALASIVKAADKDPQMMAQLRRGALQSMIHRELLLTAAQQSKAVNKEQVAKDVDELIQKQGGKVVLEKRLSEDKSISMKDFMVEIQNSALIHTYVEKDLGKDITATPEEAKKAFDDAPEKYSIPERVRASHILFAVPADASKEVDAAALKKAQDTYADLKKPDADFGKIASERSDDQGSKLQKGNLGFFTKGMLVPEFEKVAFEMKPGEISEPVKTKFGYHIIKVEEHEKAQAGSFNTVKDQIQAGLLAQKRGLAVQKKIEELRTAAKVEVKIKELS